MTSLCIILCKLGKKRKSLWEVPLSGRTLLAHAVHACGFREKVFCGDEQPLPAYAPFVHDPAKVDRIEDVVTNLLDLYPTQAEILHIVQPTSPFLQQSTLVQAERLLGAGWDSAQAVAPVPHQLHAWNQRTVRDGTVRFIDEDRRMLHPTKQSKPEHWQFGGLFSITRTAFERTRMLWTSRCAAIKVPWWQAIDVDDEDSLDLARSVAWTQRIT